MTENFLKKIVLTVTQTDFQTKFIYEFEKSFVWIQDCFRIDHLFQNFPKFFQIEMAFLNLKKYDVEEFLINMRIIDDQKGRNMLMNE